MIKLSVITVNLNNFRGLKKTIESVINQNYHDFEYIIIDGGSTDGSLEIIKQLDNFTGINLQCISEKDSGVYEAMNKGIRLSMGEYLLFLNSGDFLVNKKVLELVFATPHDSDFLLGQSDTSQNGTVIHRMDPPERITFGHLYYAGLNHQSTFIKRDLFIKYGYYREDFRYNSDIEFWYRTIILNCCTTEKLTFTISEYNTEGISSKENNSDQYKNELKEIYSNPFLRLFIPDYDAWAEEQRKMELMYWVKSKKLLFSVLQFLYAMARWIVKNKI